MKAVRETRVVLMADDDHDDFVMVKDAFAACGNTVKLSRVSDGEELLEYLFRRNRYLDLGSAPAPSLILLDLNMPRKNGSEVLAEIKTHPVLKQIPVVVLTTSKRASDVAMCYEMGANSYLTKPDSFNALVDMLNATVTYWLETVELPSYNSTSHQKQ